MAAVWRCRNCFSGFLCQRFDSTYFLNIMCYDTNRSLLLSMNWLGLLLLLRYGRVQIWLSQGKLKLLHPLTGERECLRPYSNILEPRAFPPSYVFQINTPGSGRGHGGALSGSPDLAAFCVFFKIFFRDSWLFSATNGNKKKAQNSFSVYLGISLWNAKCLCLFHYT